jgi:hypothetical protein
MPPTHAKLPVMTSFLLWIFDALFGSALGKLLAGIVAPAVGFAVVLVYRRYAIIIKRSGPHERRAYTELRNSLAQGGLPARIYAERLKVTLDAVDRFFGDAGMADQTLWPRAFGLRTLAPLWTPASFDRCLLLALIYPLVVIFVMWAASGHVGPAEQALGLSKYIRGSSRSIALALLALSTSAYWRSVSSARASARLKWLTAGAVAGAIAGSAVGSSTVSIASVVAGVVVFGTGASVGSGALAVAASFAAVWGFDPPQGRQSRFA